jgi:hypothetical protein
MIGIPLLTLGFLIGVFGGLRLAMPTRYAPVAFDRDLWDTNYVHDSVERDPPREGIASGLLARGEIVGKPPEEIVARLGAFDLGGDSGLDAKIAQLLGIDGRAALYAISGFDPHDTKARPPLGRRCLYVVFGADRHATDAGFFEARFF